MTLDELRKAAAEKSRPIIAVFINDEEECKNFATVLNKNNLVDYTVNIEEDLLENYITGIEDAPTIIKVSESGSVSIVLKGVATIKEVIDRISA